VESARHAALLLGMENIPPRVQDTPNVEDRSRRRWRRPGRHL